MCKFDYKSSKTKAWILELFIGVGVIPALLTILFKVFGLKVGYLEHAFFCMPYMVMVLIKSKMGAYK